MLITRLELTHFRNIQSCKLSPSDKLNVFIGANGSGKSSLIEAIYYLGYGRSFRTNRQRSMVMHEKEQFSVFARSLSANKNDSENINEYNVGVAKRLNGEFQCQLNGQHGSSLSSLVSLFPIQLFTPQSTELIIGSPSERRRFMDWGVFHVEHSSQKLFRSFTVLHKHRNALLKKSPPDVTQQLKIWESQFIECSEKISTLRRSFVDSLVPIFNKVLMQFLPEITLQIEYNEGWNCELGLKAHLESKYSQDLLYGNTSVGPHKADLKLLIGKNVAAEVLSRGQLRMVVAALQLAQTKTFSALSERESIFLLDDLGAELDETKRELFLDALFDTNSQVFVSAIEESQLKFISKYQNKKMFHVEHGHVTEE